MAAIRDKSAARVVLLCVLYVFVFCYKNNEKEKSEPLSLVERQIYHIIVHTRSGYCDISLFGSSESFFLNSRFRIQGILFPVPWSTFRGAIDTEASFSFFFLLFFFFLAFLPLVSLIRELQSFSYISSNCIFSNYYFPQTVSRGRGLVLSLSNS